MKRLISRIFPIFIFCIFSISLNSMAASPIVTIAVGEWPPYVSSDLKYYGLAPRIVSEAFALENVSVKYVFYPWKRAYILAKTGECDATLLWIKTPEREKDFYFSDVVVKGTAVFFHLKSYPFKWKNVEDLQNIRIGGLLSASYPWFEDSKQAGKNVYMDLVEREEQNFKKLLAKRIQIFSLDINTGYSVLHKHFTPEEISLITYHPQPIETWGYRLMFSKKLNENPHLLSAFNQGLKRLKSSGLYERLLTESQQGAYLKGSSK